MTSMSEIDQELELVLANMKEHEQGIQQLQAQLLRVQQSYIGLQGAKETLTRLKERIETALKVQDVQDQDDNTVPSA
jgi:prefoldin subunit 5